MLGTVGVNKDNVGSIPHFTEYITSEKELYKPEHTSPRTDPVHRQGQNRTDPDLFTCMNILVARPDKPVAKPA